MGIMSDLSLRLSANTAELKSGLNDAKKSLNDFSKDAKSAVMKTVDSFKGLDASNSSVKELRNALKSLNSVSFAGKSVEEIAAINAAIGRLKDEMGDLKAKQKNLGTEFGDLATKGLMGIAGLAEVGFALSSVMGMSEKNAAKMQAQMTMMIGAVQGLGQFQAMMGDKTLQTIALRIKDTAATVAQTAAQWALNTSMLVVIGTIGAIVAVVGIAIYAIYKLTSGYNAQADAVDRLRKEKEKLKQLDEEANKQYGLAYRLMVARGEDEKTLKQYQIAMAKIEMNQIEEKVKKLRGIASIEGKLSDDEIKEKKELQDRYTELEGNIQVMGYELQNLGKTSKQVSSGMKEDANVVKDAWVEAYEKALELEQYNVPRYIKGVTQPDTDVNSMKGKTNILPKQDKDFAESLKKRHALSMKFQEDEASEAAKAAKNLQDIENEKNASKLSALSNTFNLAQGLFAENTIAYKAMAIAQAGIDTYMAANVALASAPPPFNFILMGATIAAGLANVAKIAGFANGGIVGGNSYSGDKIPIRVNSGEMILNGSQQAKLFAMANFGSNNSNRGGQVEFEIKGDKLVGVLNNYGQKLNKTR